MMGRPSFRDAVLNLFDGLRYLAVAEWTTLKRLAVRGLLLAGSPVIFISPKAVALWFRERQLRLDKVDLEAFVGLCRETSSTPEWLMDSLSHNPLSCTPAVFFGMRGLSTSAMEELADWTEICFWEAYMSGTSEADWFGDWAGLDEVPRVSQEVSK
jgi:hypothetical protein